MDVSRTRWLAAFPACVLVAALSVAADGGAVVHHHHHHFYGRALASNIIVPQARAYSSVRRVAAVEITAVKAGVVAIAVDVRAEVTGIVNA